jgi:radical SAM peptide maturase (CXXX-repeat target family)
MNNNQRPHVTNLTYILTEKCNLNCNYCYVDKNCNEMDIYTARRATNFFLNQKFDTPGVVYEFLGGEPFLKIDLIYKATDYIIRQQHELNHRWKNNYMFSFTTNGTILNDEVKEYFSLDQKKKSIAVSLDGVKELQDLNRSNSYDTVIKNLEWFRKSVDNFTIKSTINHEGLPYIYESVKFFINDLGIKDVYMNLVFENVWKDGDAKILKDQLTKVADFLLENNRYNTCSVRFFNEDIYFGNDDINRIRCGSGNTMMAVDSAGILYPCIRFKTTSKQPPYVIGDIVNGVDKNKLTGFKYYPYNELIYILNQFHHNHLLNT